MSRSTLGNVPEHVIQAVKRLLQLLSQRVRVEKAYLFGSYVKGTWLKTSDVDLVIVSPDFEGIPFLKRLDMINELQWRAGITPHVETIPLTPSELKEKLKSSTVIRDASKYWIEVDP